MIYGQGRVSTGTRGLTRPPNGICD